MLENDINLNVNHSQHQDIYTNELGRGINSDGMFFNNAY